MSDAIYKELMMLDIRSSLDQLKEKLTQLRTIKNNDDTEVDEELLVHEFTILFDGLMNKISLMLDSINKEDEFYRSEIERLNKELEETKASFNSTTGVVEGVNAPIKKKVFEFIFGNKALATLVILTSIFLLVFIVLFVFHYIDSGIASRTIGEVKSFIAHLKDIIV